MTLTQGETRVRHLANQISTTNTLFDNTNFIDEALNQGRRMFASILPEEKLPKLIKSVALTVTAEVGAYPTDFFRTLKNPYVTVTAGTPPVVYVGVRIPEVERWRLKFLDNAGYSNDLLDNYYYYERSDGVVCLSNSETITAITYQYLKKPDALSGSDNIELPPDVDDLVVDFAFKKMMGTTRGNLELAVFLAKEQGLIIGAKQ